MNRWIRLSAILAIAVGMLFAAGLYEILRGMTWEVWGILAIDAVILLASGAVALAGRAPILLAIAWGWVLIAQLSRVFVSLPQTPTVITHMGHRMLVVPGGLSWGGIIMSAVAVGGLVLYILGCYRNKATS